MKNRLVRPGQYLTLGGFAALLVFMSLLPARVLAQGTVVGVDLSRYVRVARYNLPEPTRTTPPDGISLLAQEASSVTYDWDTDTLFVLGDGGTSVVQVSKTGALIDSMTLASGSSPQGTEFYDTEGITYIGHGMFVMTEERDRQLVEFTYVATTPPTFTQLHRADTKTVKLGTTIGNIGLEGVTWDPWSSGTYDPTSTNFIVVKEKDPRSIFQTGVNFAAGTATNGSPTTVESTDLFDPALIPVIDFSDIFALSNLPSLHGAAEFDQLLIISQESGQIVQVDRSGHVYHTLTLVADPGDTISIPDMTNEGVTMDRNGILYIADEDGGGDANHPQLWVYAPSLAANLAPTAITLKGAVASLPENTSTASTVRLADILVTDDGLGDNTLSVSGADAGSFEIVGTALFLKAGTILDATAKPSYHINVNVDDATVGGSPDASTAYTLTITAASAGAINLAITEAAPWSSGNSPASLAADWFEVTNFGTGAVSLVGWTMDDNSNSSSVSVPLHGVASIAPGESVIFIETADLSDGTLATKATAFINLWFGGTAPAGLQIGSYSGSGVGLSTGGDAVNLFDNGGTLRANISFPAVPAGPPFYTFDNTAGVNNALISNLSTVGLYGAHAASSDANEIGSPGTIGSGAAPIINITATDANASETGPDPGTFRISRSGSSVSPLTVDYTIAAGAGQATSGDYTPTLTGSATIAAGDSFVDLTITPVDDALVEGPETVTLTLFDTGSYDVGSPASATVTIADNDALNLPPTAVILSNTVPTLGEATSTASAVRVADISVTDDGLGVNTLSLSGADAAFFQITGSSLFLKGGTVLNHTTKPSYSVTVNVDDVTVDGSPDAHADFVLTITASVAPGTIVISEVAPWSSSNSPIAVDWFEVTNTGKTPVDMTGWKMDDNSHAIANAVPMNGITSIGPGEAVIFMEAAPADLAAKAAAFRSLWFGSNPPATLQIGSYSGSGVGLSSNGDEVALFDAAGNLVTGVGFPAAPSGPFATFDNHSGAGGTSLPLPMVSTLSVVGVNGAFAAAGDTSEIGSPGIGNVGRLIISEVTPWGSSASYGADWFEVTNVGSAAVDMTGYQMDDNSNGTAKVTLTGVGSVAPGQSAVFIETTAFTPPATPIPAFKTAWFGGSVPSGFTIGTYSGGGVGLSATADAVNLFDSTGNRITGVQFGAATTNFSFDNTAGLGSPTIPPPLPFISTLSVAGVNGAFLAADGLETGSPGLAFLSKPTSTALTSSLNPSVLGQSVRFTATVTTTAAGTPSGMVTFKDSSTSIGTVTLNTSGVATLDTSSLTVGPHPITAAYVGDVPFTSSTSITVTQVVAADAIAPTAAPTQSPSPNGAGWNMGDVTVTWNWTDNPGGSGIDNANCTTSTTSSGEGTLQLNAACKDLAGNTGNAQYTVKVDVTVPTAAPTQLPAANGAGWNKGDVNISWNWTDSGSGIDAANCTTTLTSSGEGTLQLNAACKDLAGNTGNAQYTVKVDKTQPLISFSGNAGSYTVDQVISITCNASDALSGLASSTCPEASGPAYSFPLGLNSLPATATDVAGNTANLNGSFTVNVTYDSLGNLVQQFFGPAGAAPAAPVKGANGNSSGSGIANSLLAKLSAAAKSTAKGGKANQINAFINEVNAQSGKAIPADEAAILIALAGAL